MNKNLNIVGKKHIFFIISACLIVFSIIMTLISGLSLAIEFKGGSLISYTYENEIDGNKIVEAVKTAIDEDVIVKFGESISDNSTYFQLSFSSKDGLELEKQSKLSEALKNEFKDNNLEILSSTDVNPSSGKEFFIKCLIAVIFAVIVMILYIGFRFRRIGGWSAGVTAVVALIHDMIMVYGCFVVCGFSIDANFIAVLLTILGYSINATIIIYDRIRENRRLLGDSISVSELVNLSINQTLGRSIHTTVTTVSALVVICIVCAITGVSSIMSFALPLIIGMLAGAYSSNCIAPTLWVLWQEKFHKNSKKVSARR